MGLVYIYELSWKIFLQNYFCREVFAQVFLFEIWGPRILTKLADGEASLTWVEGKVWKTFSQFWGFSRGTDPTNPNSNLPLFCGLQKQGVCRSTDTLDKVSVAVTLTQLDPNNSHSPTRGFCVILLNYELLATTWCFKVAWPAEADGSVPIFSAGGKQERTTEKPQCSLNYWKIMQYSNKSLNCYKSSLLHFLLRQEVY